MKKRNYLKQIAIFNLTLSTIIALLLPATVNAEQILVSDGTYAFYDFESFEDDFRPALPGWQISANAKVMDTETEIFGNALNMGKVREVVWLEPSDKVLEAGRVHFGFDMRVPEMTKESDRRFFYVGIIDGMCKSLEKATYNYSEVNIFESTSWHGKNEFTLHLSDDVIDWGVADTKTDSVWMHIDIVGDIEKLEEPKVNTWHNMTDIMITHKVMLTYYLTGADGITRMATGERLIADGFVGFCVSAGVDASNMNYSTFIDNVYMSVLRNSESPHLSIVNPDGRLVRSKNGKIEFMLNDRVTETDIENCVEIFDETGKKVTEGIEVTPMRNGKAFVLTVNDIASGKYTVKFIETVRGENFNTSMKDYACFYVDRCEKQYDFEGSTALPDGWTGVQGYSIKTADEKAYGNVVEISSNDKKARNGAMVALDTPADYGKVKIGFDVKHLSGDLRIYTHNGLSGYISGNYVIDKGIQQLLKCESQKPNLLTLHNDKINLKKDKVQNISWNAGVWNRIEVEASIKSANLCDIAVYVNGKLCGNCKDRPIDFGFAGLHFLSDGKALIDNVKVEYSVD